MFFHDPRSVGMYQRIFKNLEGTALNEEDSAAMLRKEAARLS